MEEKEVKLRKQCNKTSMAGVNLTKGGETMITLFQAIGETAPVKRPIDEDWISRIAVGDMEALQRLCSGQVGSRLDLPYGIVARKSYDCIELYRAGTQETEQETFCEQPKVRDGEQTVVYLPDGGNLIFSIKHLRDFGADAYREIIKMTIRNVLIMKK